MENAGHFALFPASNLFFSPFKIFFAECKIWISENLNLYVLFEHVNSRHLKEINVSRLVFPT